MNLNRKHDSFDKWIDAKVIYEGSRYQPVSHRIVIETIMENLYKKHLEIKKQHYLTDKDASKAIGVLNLGSLDSELDFSLAWRNSLDGTKSFSIVSGSQVSVCSNSCIWGDSYSFKRKHTGNAIKEIAESLDLAVNQFDEVRSSHLATKQLLKDERVDHNTLTKIVGGLFLDNILNASQLNIVKRELEAPTFDYKAKGSAWETYNHCTVALKESHPSNWIEAHKNVSDFFSNIFL